MSKNRSAGTAKSTVAIENDRVRVTQWRFAKRGDNTGWHRHAYDYVVVPLFNGALEIENESGQRARVEMESGVPYFRNAGVEHDVSNGNDFACAFVEVEILK